MKLMLVCTSGGHFATMRGLEKFWSQHDRVWVTDYKEDTSVLEGVERVYWLPFQGPRDWLAFLRNLPATLKILFSERPDVVFSTGASIAVNFAIFAKLLGIRFVFIECISRFEELSLSGKLVYPIADEIYVQSPLLQDRYPKSSFQGIVL